MAYIGKVELYRPGLIEGYVFDEQGNGNVLVSAQVGEFKLISTRANIPRPHLAPAPHDLNVGFLFHFDLEVWRLLPDGTPIGLFAADGSEIVFAEAPLAVVGGAQDGGEALRRRLAMGTTINKWGSFSHCEGLAERSNLIIAYRNIDRIHHALLGQHLFLNYGTLLGLVRDGTLIPWDDDFDVGYFSYAQNTKAFFNDFERRVTILRETGQNITIIRTGQFHWQDSETGLELDIFGSWKSENAELNMIFALLAPGGAEELLPLQPRIWPKTDITAWVPKRPEKFLELIYGINWSIPDPTFSWRESPLWAQNVRSIVAAAMKDGDTLLKFAEESAFRASFFCSIIQFLNNELRGLKSMRNKDIQLSE